MTPKIKICGFTDPNNIKQISFTNINAIGLNFYEKSKRFVSIDNAKKIIALLPPFVKVIALFVNNSKENIHQVLKNVSIDAIQFHGDEDSEFCEQFSYPYIKSIAVNEGVDFVSQIDKYKNAKAVLFDSFDRQNFGGTGKSFNWQLLNKPLQHKYIILAGGLTHSNIAQAIKIVKPYAVDICSAVESSYGIKDAQKINQLIKIIKDNEIL